ncbi:MAG TPA: phytanoyl-CoA dioxygenase family protein [Acidimicrobiales bacterium]|nr:phytanoyl-CoA dioxygenase family protein [Acidimicrobiales bacterium]
MEPTRLSEARAAWERHGWCLLEACLPAEDLAGVPAALGHLFPTAAEMEEGETDQTRRWRDWDAAWPEFPFRSATLNRLALHDAVLDLAETLLGDDVRLYLALVTAKFAGQSSGYNRLLHADYPNHMLVVPRAERGYQQLELLIYLCDVSEANGATHFLSVEATAEVPVERHTLDVAEYAQCYEDDVAACGPSGSIAAYRPDVYHRSVDPDTKGFSRFLLHVSFRPAAAEWGGYQAWPFKGFSPEWHRFVAGAGPRQLGVLGFPRPGHPYWTEETLAGVGARYPGLDLSPWREAAARS